MQIKAHKFFNSIFKYSYIKSEYGTFVLKRKHMSFNIQNILRNIYFIMFNCDRETKSMQFSLEYKVEY